LKAFLLLSFVKKLFLFIMFHVAFYFSPNSCYLLFVYGLLRPLPLPVFI
jgi:hypothetical protein